MFSLKFQEMAQHVSLHIQAITSQIYTLKNLFQIDILHSLNESVIYCLCFIPFELNIAVEWSRLLPYLRKSRVRFLAWNPTIFTKDFRHFPQGHR
jgi:hypothetical protein